MRTLTTLRAIVVASVLGLCVCSAPSVYGQGGGVLNPNSSTNTTPQRLDSATAAPQPSPSKPYPTWVGYLAIALMVGAIMGVSLIPSKRSHQD